MISADEGSTDAGRWFVITALAIVDELAQGLEMQTGTGEIEVA